MTNTFPEEWLHGPDADPNPAIAEAVALITQQQLGLLSDTQRESIRQRLSADPAFAAIAAPMLIAARVVRNEAELQRRAEGESARMAKILARLEAERLSKRGHFNISRPLWRLAATLFAAVTLTVCTVSAYGAVLHSRIHPASVAFDKAPLSVVMVELRRRYHIDVEVCDAGFNQDSVTLTVNDAPIDSVTNIIARQTLRWAHWKVSYTGREYTLLLQPQPDMSRGWWYNIRLFVRSFTYMGCHR